MMDTSAMSSVDGVAQSTGIVQESRNPRRLTEAGIALMTLAISGDPAISFGHQEALVIALVILLYGPRILINRGRGVMHLGTAYVWFLGIFIIQGLSFRFFPLATILGFFLKLLVGFSFMSTLRNPLRAYLDAMCVLVAFSFLFFIPHQIGLFFGWDLKQAVAVFRVPLPQDDHFHILVHNFNNLDNEHRNSGIFWEPGAFAGYLVLGLILSTFLARKADVDRPWRWCFPWLMAGLLTTQSTTGFLMIPFLIALKRFDKIFGKAKPKTVLLRIFGSLCIVLVVSILLFQIPWVGQKFTEQIQSSLSGQGAWAITRFGSFIFDLQYIELRPFTGWGLHSSTRYMLHPYLAELLGQGQGNGLSDFLAKVGLLGFGFYIWKCFIGLRKISDSSGKAALAIGIVSLTLFGEAFLGFPLFLGLMFLPLATGRKSISSNPAKSKL